MNTADPKGTDRRGSVRPGRGDVWGSGYVVEVPYVDELVTDLCPTSMSAVSVLRGQPPLSPDSELTWLDLGSGNGVTACMVAAGNPHIEVWGFDFNPSHIDRARDLRSQAGLKNCHFHEASFAQLAADRSLGPSEVDVVVVNGVYSWIAEDQQRHIADIIGQRLRPGGMAFIMYEVATGWSSMEPVVEALRVHADATSQRPDEAFMAASAAVTELADAGAASFPLAPREAVQMGRWSSSNPLYAAHEYLGDHFGPLMFDAVQAEMAAARCSYLGGLELYDHLPRYWAPPTLVDLVASIANVTTREMMRDLISQRPLRRDLFRRGLRTCAPLQTNAWVGALEFIGLGVPYADKPVSLSAGEVNLDAEYHRPLTDALAGRRLTVGAVLDIHPGWTPLDANIALSLQVAAGYAAPAIPGPPNADAIAATRRFNQVLIDENFMGANHCGLAAAATGGGVAADMVELLALGLMLRGSTPDQDVLTDSVLELLTAQDRMVREDGALVTDPEDGRKIIAERVGRALSKAAGAWVQLGICDASLVGGEHRTVGTHQPRST